ncbi:MAG: homoserine dehydrogenase, partial [Acidaminobacteraceae bacterium]
AEHGEELMKIAKANNVSLMFEASVGGGIPILKPLKECLGGNRIDSIVAIINGTTNFILSKMYDENMGYEDALKLAQDAGFAESDPTSDVEGLDAGRKISILSSLAYEKRIDWRKVVTKGITKLDIQDITNAKAIKSKIKLLAISKRIDDQVHLSVRPVYVPKNSSIGKIDNEFNGVIIDGDSVGNLMFYGKGAGRLPTASSIFGDLVDIIQNRTDLSNVVLSNDFTLALSYPIKSKWVLRLMASNINDTIEELFGYFNDITININKSENKNLLFATVDNLTESELENIVASISSASFVVDKYTLMYE